MFDPLFFFFFYKKVNALRFVIFNYSFILLYTVYYFSYFCSRIIYQNNYESKFKFTNHFNTYFRKIL
jgi:hypothetical protein